MNNVEVNSQLANQARGIAMQLTYNEDDPQAAAKHTLIECSHRLNTLSIWVGKDGKQVWNKLGKSRYMTFKEQILWRLFNVVPTRV